MCWNLKKVILIILVSLVLAYIFIQFLTNNFKIFIVKFIYAINVIKYLYFYTIKTIIWTPKYNRKIYFKLK